MSQQRQAVRSFASGEITPELFGRIDLPKAQEGVALCRNFVALPHGPLQNRAGTQYVDSVKTHASATRLLPFTYNNTITYAIQMGAGFFRFHSLGGTVTSAGVPYEIANTYAAADLFAIRFEQYGNKLTLTHPSYAPMELTCAGATSWTFAAPSFNPPATTGLGTPTVTASPSSGSVPAYSYMITGVLATSLEETVATTKSADQTNDLSVAGNKNTIAWTDTSGGLYVRYNVYKLFQGLYGYIGQAGGLSFVDQNIYPDTSRTPPISDTLFSGANNYPTAVGYHEQRRGFAGTNNDPQKAWFTRTGTDSNMSYNIPVRDDSRIAFRVASREASQIKHIVSLQDMILLTGSCEWRVSTGNAAFTPSTVSVKPQSYVGCNDTRPVVAGNMILFAAARGGHLREMAYSWQSTSYITSDASILAPHLFDGYTITDMAMTRGNTPVVWCISSSGKLLGMTYLPDRQIIAWHQHDTGNGDAFESVCAITENNDEVLYVVVRRTIGGATKRYVEMLHSRQFTALADAFFVDSGLTYSGAPATTVSGLTWLEGRTVNILADGAVCPPQVVTSGAVSIPYAASKITVGLPIAAQVKTAPASAASDAGYAQGRMKNVNRVMLRVDRASGIKAGPDFDTLTPYAQRTNEPYGSPPAMVNDEIEIMFGGAWGTSGQTCIQQDDPLPVTLVSETIEFVVGGG